MDYELKIINGKPVIVPISKLKKKSKKDIWHDTDLWGRDLW
jgi:hypothetical protein